MFVSQMSAKSLVIFMRTLDATAVVSVLDAKFVSGGVTGGTGLSFEQKKSPGWVPGHSGEELAIA
jgi:hypothetical protein